MRISTFTAGLVCTLAFLASNAAAQDNGEVEEDSKFNYVVDEEGRVDESIMMGFNVYTGSCMACHGPDGLGSSFAPSLLRAAERRTFEVFAQTIAEGRSLQPGMVMPSFGGDIRVMSHLEDLWNYLGARQQGDVGRGRPRPIETDAVEDAKDAD